MIESSSSYRPLPLFKVIEEVEEIELRRATREEQIVWAIIRNHRGRLNSIRLKNITLATSLNARAVRDAIHSLIVSHHKLIGSSSSGKCGGYWIVQTDEELAEAMGELRSRIKRLSERARALDKLGYRRLLRELQGSLWQE